MAHRFSLAASRKCLRAISFGAAAMVVALGTRAETVSLISSKDVTIYNSSGDVSNAAGQYCFVGTNGTNVIRRTLIEFDLTSIPGGSTITDATLTLNLSMTNVGPLDVTVHRVIEAWGEGTSMPTDNGSLGTAATTNDATWMHRFYDTAFWAIQGGDFVAAAAAVTAVGAVGPYSWTSVQLTADVQQWVNNPSENHGWILRGDETVPGTSKRFDTKENLNIAARPRLSVSYSLPCISDVNGNGVADVQDMLLVINAWGTCANPNVCPSDIAPPGGDDVVNVADLLAVINQWGTCP